MGMFGMHSWPSFWKWCSASQKTSNPDSASTLAIAAALSKTVASCSSGSRRLFTGIPGYPMSSMSTWPANKLPKVIMGSSGTVSGPSRTPPVRSLPGL